MITFNGITSDQMHLYVEQYPTVAFPRRKQTVVSVPGRNGDIVITQAAFENVLQSYDIYISGDRAGKTLTEAAQDVIEWLCVPGYKRLTDSYTPGVYREAYFSGGDDIENALNHLGRARITFSCKPQKFLSEYDQEYTITNGGTNRNPTSHTAYPIITLVGGSGGSVTIGGNTLTITGDLDGMVIDSYDMEAVRNGSSANSQCSGNFPVLLAGTNTIALTGSITSIKLRPRYFRL